MSLAFVNFSLIFGGLLLAIPIVLHLVMRQQPKQLVFPALRFLRQRHDTNRRQLQLRHWLLLLLRCLAVALPAAALARPSVGSRAVGDWAIIGILAGLLVVVTLLGVLSLVQQRGRVLLGVLAGAACVLLAALGWMLHAVRHRDAGAAVGNERAPVAAVLVFDSSVRMQYRWENQTRLEQAQTIARWLIRQLPADSEVAVVDSRSPRAVFAVDLAAAERAIQRMETTCVPQPLGQSVAEAVRLARTSALSRREVYVFSDLARQAWSAEPPVRWQRTLAEAPEVLLYVVDTGVERPRNLALGDIELSTAVLSRSSPLEVKTTIEQVGGEDTAAVELFLEDLDPQRPFLRDGRVQLPESRLRSQQVAALAGGAGVPLTFRLRNLEPGVHQGQIKIAAQDGLAIDNVRYFTVEVQDAVPVLVLAPPGVITKYFVEAVAPYEFRQAGRGRYACTVRAQSELVNAELDSYAAVCLLDPGPLTPRDWERLAAYVGRGRGLALFLGHNAVPALFSEAAAYPLVGGKLTRQWRSAGDLFLAPRNFGHPVMAAFREMATAVPWNQFPVYRHWVLEDLSPATQVIVPYGNNKPAVVETAVGAGRVLVMTTPLSDPPRLRGREPWNELPTGEDPWPFVVLVNELLRYIVDTAGTKLNYLAGETAVLANSRDKHPDRYELFTPLNQPQEVAAAEGRLTVKFTEYPGAYRLKGQRGGIVIRGFGVNVPRAATDLTRLAPQELDAFLGAGRYRLARSPEELAPGVGEARLGREFFPVLWLVFGLILALEQVLANRFYRGDAPAAAQT